MSLSITATDTTPNVGDAINLTAVDAPANTDEGYDPEDYPASPAILYYLTLDKTGVDSLVSERFTPDAVNGEHTWPSVVIPSAGSWVANLRLDEDDSSVANLSITASA